METQDLQEILDQQELVPLTGSGARKSVIDWDATIADLSKRGWFRIPDVQKELEADLAEEGITKGDGSPKEVHYSQVMGKLQRLDNQDSYEVTKTKYMNSVYFKVEAA